MGKRARSRKIDEIEMEKERKKEGKKERKKEGKKERKIGRK